MALKFHHQNPRLIPRRGPAGPLQGTEGSAAEMTLSQRNDLFCVSKAPSLSPAGFYGPTPGHKPPCFSGVSGTYVASSKQLGVLASPCRELRWDSQKSREGEEIRKIEKLSPVCEPGNVPRQLFLADGVRTPSLFRVNWSACVTLSFFFLLCFNIFLY